MAFTRFIGLIYFLSAIFLSLMTYVGGHAQHGILAPNFDYLTIDDGLSQTTVHEIIEDRNGQIWIGTRFGLNRYDGYEFDVFLPQENSEEGLRGHAVYSLLEDQEGNIWVGHQDRGISIYATARETFIPFPKEEFPGIDWETLSVRKLYKDSKGNIWIGTYGAGVLVMDSEKKARMQLCSYCHESGRYLNNDFIFDFQEDRERNIWIGTAGEGVGVYNFQEDSVHVVSEIEGNRIGGFGRELSLDEEGDLWIGTAGNGIFKLSLPEEKITQHFDASLEGSLTNDIITDLELDDNGQLWIATDGGGINCYDPAVDQWKHHRHSAKRLGTLNTDAIYDLMFDGYGNLWVGTFNGGINLHRKKPEPFAYDREYIQEQLVGLRSVLALAKGPKGSVWMGTDGAGLYRLESKKSGLQVYPFENPEIREAINVITSIAVDFDGNLWLGTFGKGLFYLDPQKGIIQHFLHDETEKKSISHNNVWDLEIDREGGLWIGTLGGGLNYLPKGTSSFLKFDEVKSKISPSLSGVQLVDIMLDRRGENLWVATENSGLNRILLNEMAVEHYRSQPEDSQSLSSDRLRCLYEDEEGTIWIGTEYGGLNLLNPQSGSFQRFSQENGLPSNMIHGILEDSAQQLWISTQAGIVRWEAQSRTFINIGSDPFLQNNQFNPNATLNLDDGRLLFGSTNGYAVVNPFQITAFQNPPEVIFSGLRISNEPIKVDENRAKAILPMSLNDSAALVHLSYKDRGIQFDLTTVCPAQAAWQAYEYRLENYGTFWQKLKPGRRTVNYSGLPGGTYSLEVRAIGPSGKKGPVKRLNIQVEPPIWKKGWFIMLEIMAIILFVWAIVAFLLQRQKSFYQLEKVKSEQEILRLQNENLEKDIANQRSRLSASVMQTAHKNSFLNQIKSQIKELKTDSTPNDLKKVIRKIDRELKQEDYWKQFQLVFDKTHTEFIQKLELQHASLTDNEKRLCCFIRMQLSNREIASILNITVNGVEQAKYRIKKKLDLPKPMALNDYIRDF